MEWATRSQKKRLDANDIEYIDDIDTVRHRNPKGRSTY